MKTGVNVNEKPKSENKQRNSDPENGTNDCFNVRKLFYCINYCSRNIILSDAVKNNETRI